MGYAAAGGCGTDGAEQLHRHDVDLHSGVLRVGIWNVRAAAVLSIVLRGGRYLGSESGGEHRVAEVFPVWTFGVGVAVVDILESTADGSGDRNRGGKRWRGSGELKTGARVVSKQALGGSHGAKLDLP